MKRTFLLIIVSINLYAPPAMAQDDLLEMLEKQDTIANSYSVNATFKGTRIINGHSVELRTPGVLDFLISHRFGRLNSGAYEFFGLDEANVRIGLEYGLFKNFNIGIGRNSFEKTYDGFLKYKLLQQTSMSPISAVLFTSAAINSLRSPDPERSIDLSGRLFYTYQVLLARKFNPDFSLQLSPTLVHRNLVASRAEYNDIYAIGIGGRHKLSKRFSLNAEYYYRLNPDADDLHHNSLALGLDIETGGHVFQLHFSNSRAMIEKGFTTETSGDFFEGDVHFGFNISRVFDLRAGKK